MATPDTVDGGCAHHSAFHRRERRLRAVCNHALTENEGRSQDLNPDISYQRGGHLTLPQAQAQLLGVSGDNFNSPPHQDLAKTFVSH